MSFLVGGAGFQAVVFGREDGVAAEGNGEFGLGVFELAAEFGGVAGGGDRRGSGGRWGRGGGGFFGGESGEARFQIGDFRLERRKLILGCSELGAESRELRVEGGNFRGGGFGGGFELLVFFLHE